MAEFAGEEAPVISEEAMVFENLTEEQQAQITMMVPEAVFESFKASPVWKYITLQAVGQAIVMAVP